MGILSGDGWERTEFLGPYKIAVVSRDRKTFDTDFKYLGAENLEFICVLTIFDITGKRFHGAIEGYKHYENKHASECLQEIKRRGFGGF